MLHGASEESLLDGWWGREFCLYHSVQISPETLPASHRTVNKSHSSQECEANHSPHYCQSKEWMEPHTHALTLLHKFHNLFQGLLCISDWFRTSMLPAIRMWFEVHKLHRLFQCNELCYAKWMRVLRHVVCLPNNESLVNEETFSECLKMLNAWPLEYPRADILFDKLYTLKYIITPFFNVRSKGIKYITRNPLKTVEKLTRK